MTRTFVITGSASGIGAYLTEGLIDRGHRVLATDVNLAGLQARARTRGWPVMDRVRTRGLDVRDPAEWEATFEEAASAFGGVDVLLNIAGYMRSGPGHEMSAEDVHRHLDINTKGVIFGTQAAARHMIPRRQGHIVNMGSMTGLAPIPGISVYCASKHAVRAFSLATAYELRRHGIAVTVVCPDAVETPMTDRLRSDDASAVVFSAARLLSVEEIGDLILGRVLEERPAEVAYPGHRAWLARVANLFPGLYFSLAPMMVRRGQAQLRRLRARAGA